MWCRWCKACVGRTWRGEKVGQRHQEGHHLLRVPCLGDTWAPRSLRVPVGTDSERRVAIWCCIWCRDLGFLRLFFIVSQLFVILCNFTPCLLFTLFLGPSEQQSGININGKEKIRSTVSTCPCRICIYFMPTMQLTHSGSTGWLQRTGGQAWWRHRTKSWKSMMNPPTQSSQSHWETWSQTARLTKIVDGAWRRSNGPPYGAVPGNTSALTAMASQWTAVRSQKIREHWKDEFLWHRKLLKTEWEKLHSPTEVMRLKWFYFRRKSSMRR